MSEEAAGRVASPPDCPATPEPFGLGPSGGHSSRGVSAEFRAKIESEMAELGMAPHPLALEAAYAIWLYSQPDGFVIYQGPDESECYGYAWRALEAAGIPSAPGIAAPEGSEPKVRTEGKSPIGVVEAPQTDPAPKGE